MTKGLSENTKKLITQLRSVGNSDEAIAMILKIDLDAIKSFRSLSLLDPNEDKEEMIKLYRQGWSTTKIGEKLGWSRGTVQKLLKKEIPDEYRAIKKIDDVTDAAIKQMLVDGYTYEEISRELDVSITAIARRSKQLKQ